MTLSTEQRALLDLLITGNGSPVALSAHRNEARIEPASHAQRRLWFIDQIEPGKSPYVLHSVLNCDWDVDASILERAINTIVERHEILRTTIVNRDGEPFQNIRAEVCIPLESLDLRAVPVDERAAELTRQISHDVQRPFDLEAGPLLRTYLYQMAEREFLFLLVVHHIVFDGPSFPLFFAELRSIYSDLAAGRQPSLPARTAQYADFARNLRETLSPERIAQQVEFWRTELDGMGTLDLPLSRTRPATPTFRGAMRRLVVPAATCEKLQQVATTHRTTLFAVLLAGATATLGRICRQNDFAIGVPVTGRDAAKFRDAIGFFVDTAVVRCKFDGDPVLTQLIDSVRDAVLRSLAHRVLPFELLVEYLQPPRELGMNPIFQVGFQLMYHEGEQMKTPAANLTRGAMFDLGFNLWLEGDAIGGRLEYNTDLFDLQTIDLIVTVFSEALEFLTEPQRRLSELPLLGPNSPLRPAIMQGERVPLKYRSLIEMVDEAGERSFETALEGPNVSFTYGGLKTVCTQMAQALVRRGVVEGDIVGLCLPRSTELCCFELALWRIGAAFVLIDPSWPEERRRHVVADTGVKLLIDERAAHELSTEKTEPASLPSRSQDNGPAYVIYTSGSTGTAKGVLLRQAGLVNVATTQRQLFGLGPGRRIAQLASPSFDASIFELVLALATGATLVVPPPEALAGDELADFLQQGRVDTVVIPPSLLATISPVANRDLQLVCVAGESCPVDLAAQWQAGREFWNLYGPTEATIWATFGRGEICGRIPIGQVIPNMTTLVVDSDLRPVPVGVVGELCLAGIGLAEGYWNRPALTSERFIQDDGAGQRLYRTGDLVRQSADDQLIFTGRVDRQMKIRGFRIEPEEVESVLRKHSAVQNAAVIAKRVNGGNPALVAYLICRDEPQVVEECRRFAQSCLPHYMVPAHFVVVDEFPRTASGKIDNDALPAPNELLSAARPHVSPATNTERQVAEWMAHATNQSRVSANDDFFLMGGHSLAAARLVATARAVLKVDLKIRDIFSHRTVRELAARIDELAREPKDDESLDLPLVRQPRNTDPPQPAQRRASPATPR